MDCYVDSPKQEQSSVRSDSPNLLDHQIAPAISPKSTLQNIPYFWGKGSDEGAGTSSFPIHRGYVEASSIIGDGNLGTMAKLGTQALQYVNEAFSHLSSTRASTANGQGPAGSGLTSIRLSPSLQKWRQDQFALGRILPAKGPGLTRASPTVLTLLGAEDWPRPLLTNDALFGSGMANMFIGAYDPATLFSNYCTDMAFYYEHGYHKVFPELGELLRQSVADEQARRTPAGRERRIAVEIGLRYIRGKIALEEEFKGAVAYKTAPMDRRTAQVVFLLESSLMSMGAEAIARGFDPAATMSDLVFSSPGTDVVDVGSDILNSEVLNSFLNTTDITGSGIVSEEALRRVYDAYAHTGARMLTERWSEPIGRMCAILFCWHIQNDRHMFLRRAVLGREKAKRFGRTEEQPQREGDFDEVFDESFHTTGFSRPLKDTCNGMDPCDQVERCISSFRDNAKKDSLTHLWWCLSTGPLKYVELGVLSKAREDELGEMSRLAMATFYSKGLIDEMTWLLLHAVHHAWQINRLFETAMFGSLLDNGELKGKLDRIDD
ncbi:hypothetical protein EV356DRAFT_528950 [Viridothelium virens]|uniref:Uncharacterized protein n=1 Tax=Viridothelium virens TaxID=1048519 RepID=A0A6A6HM25_VIRVR|nr:hypothetical protein EV356DRAFT_528950 [Viridothelium virens]